LFGPHPTYLPNLVTLTENPSYLSGAIRGCSSWGDIQGKLRDLPNKEKGDVFEALVKAYLQIEPEYASKLKHVWLHREVPRAVAKKLKLPATDQGIDLVAETNDGAFWAVQCKYRQDTDHSLTWREISTFTGLAFGICRGFTFGIICSTTERITHVLRDQERIGFCALDVWQGLDVGFLTRLLAHLGHQPKPLVPTKPRPHQQEAVKAGRQHFVVKKAKRGKLIMPCGSGKSLTAYWIAKKLGARRIVIAVPSLALIRQTLKVWLRETMANRRAVEWICVCSDESAGRIERDDLAVLRQDLGVPCLTAPDDIAAWLRRKHSGLTVVFTTYQSGEALAKAACSTRFRFDLGIMDEAHKTVGAGDKLFSHLLHDANLPIGRRIFMTATERRYAGQSDAVLSMDNPAVYGETFHLLSFKRALEYRPPILSDYKIISIAVSRDEVAELIRKNVFVRPDKGRWNREIEADMLASLIALRKAMAKHPIRHAVSFHSSIQRAELFRTHNDAFSHAVPEHGSLETYHVSGKTPTGTRARIIGEFAKTQRGLITNARCLTEGVDVPGIDCVLFADPRRSAVDIVQAVGRALRPAPGKKLGYVIVPILHDADATPDDIFESESFQEILTTLRALAANDDRIIEYFRAVSQGRQLKGGGSVEFDMDERLTQRIDLAQFVRDIDLKCWDRLAKLSWRPFEEARQYARGLGFKSQGEWEDFCQSKLPGKALLPPDIPSNPNLTYAGKGWDGMGDWLGTGTVATWLRKYRPFNQARAFIRSLGLKNSDHWKEYLRGNLPGKGRLPPDIPAKPARTYADKGWAGMRDWLGTGVVFIDGKRQFRQFKQARTFVRSLGLRNWKEWMQFCKGKLPVHGVLPTDIPVSANRVYSGEGWASWGDWLGTGIIAPRLRQYRSFHKARAFARKLRFKSGDEWIQFCKGMLPGKGTLPADIPASPNQAYAKKGWASWGDWLGTGTVAPSLRHYRPFTEGRAFARSLGLKSGREWTELCKGKLAGKGALPSDIPAHPNQTYSDEGWAGMGDWLGTGAVSIDGRRHFRPFTEGRAFARSLGLKNFTEWREFCSGNLLEKGIRPLDIPASPYHTYVGKDWISWGDWLGTGEVSLRLRQYRAFRKARAFARGLGLRSGSEWAQFCKGSIPEKGTLPSDIPASPYDAYAGKGWTNWGDWLGTGAVAFSLRQYRPFRQARAFVRSLGLNNGEEWKSFCRGNLSGKGALPPDIPANPNQSYADEGWISMGDWLGTGTVASRLRQYRPFRQARAFVRGLGLKSGSEWAQFCKGNLPEKGALSADIPVAASRIYADKGWAGMGDWLGTGTVAPRLRQYRPFKQARAFARKLGLKSSDGWAQFCKGNLSEKGTRPRDIPSNPDKTYADKGWVGMGDWLGTGTLPTQLRRYRPFRQARAFVRGLYLKNRDEWEHFCKGNLPVKGVLPPDIPVAIRSVYASKGWTGWGDWLGTGRTRRAGVNVSRQRR
jgi:superfamily II DNA or RNA helicase